MKYPLSAEDAKSLCRLFYEIAPLEDLKTDFFKRVGQLQFDETSEQRSIPNIEAFLYELTEHLSLTYEFTQILKYKYDFLG